MKWINFFANYSIPYYIYKIEKEDSILLNNSYKNVNKSIIIIHGSIYIIKIFINQEILPVAILGKNNIFTLKEKNVNYKFYYKLIALETTYLISFSLNNLKNNYALLLNIIKSYNNTLEKYEVMNEIISQKYAKNRTVQLILFLCLEFGIVNKKEVYLPFKLSQRSLAIMSHTNKTTINKIIKYTWKKINIKYSNKKNVYIQNIFSVN
uniref:Global nitrogen transcriptional regulator n=1 Tax=Bostrychia tenella TaxID=324755 RepID=A0A1Z1M6D8_9FLOR|nr:global nitrogen transcriptional regulator [Bostrychia tenella]ARW61335.1 global nitrogen transcriptional regulator [Bostrychia tenella]